MNPGEVSTFGGRLIWWGGHTWAWSDNTPEPRASTLHPSAHFNFRVRSVRGEHLVEVPVRLTRTDPTLAWVRDGKYPTTLSGDHTGMLVLHADGRMTRAYADPITGETTGARVIPQVYLVPAADWEAWGDSNPVGAVWDKAHEAAIIAKAVSLGWKAPE